MHESQDVLFISYKQSEHREHCLARLHQFPPHVQVTSVILPALSPTHIHNFDDYRLDRPLWAFSFVFVDMVQVPEAHVKAVATALCERGCEEPVLITAPWRSAAVRASALCASVDIIMFTQEPAIRLLQHAYS